MTALQLLGGISAALLLQLIAGLGVGLWRSRSAVPADPRGNELSVPPATSGAWPGLRDFRVVRRQYEDAARSQCSFHLEPVDGVPLAPFAAGQYLTLSLQVPEGTAGDARTVVRCYSMSDRPDPRSLRITVKRALPPRDRPDLPPGVASGHLHDRVHEGDVLTVRAPAGMFFVDPDTDVPAVLVAGGIGISPMMSMLRWCATERPARPVHLFYGVRSGADHAFKQALEDLAIERSSFRLHVAYSNPAPGDVPGRDYRHTGRIDLALLRDNLPPGRHQFYVCGPPSMMQAIVPALRGWGVDPDDIRFESFGPASMQPAATPTRDAASGPSFEVRFRRSGRTLRWDGQDTNLLDFAERQGLPIESGCRTGSCGSCETRVLAGSVRYAAKPDHDIAAGHCLPCVATPASALELEA